MTVIGVIGTLIINSHMEEIHALSFGSIELGMDSIVGILFELSFWAFAAYLVMGFADWRYQEYEHQKKLKMSKQDIKDEHKNLEGDPQMKARMRQMGQSMVKKQQLAKVPTADVIITNPTHYAIAIRYDPDVAPAPHVVAKGLDYFALKIREVAEEHNVERVENRALARSLYDAVDPGEMIPPNLFVAVAEVLAYVYSKQKGRKAKYRPKSR
jgi:flagellar biosynthetic protein FlhB